VYSRNGSKRPDLTRPRRRRHRRPCVHARTHRHTGPRRPIVAAPATAPAVAVPVAATVTATPDTTVPAAQAPDHSQMTTMNTAMTENMAKMEAADVARRADEDSEQPATRVTWR